MKRATGRTTPGSGRKAAGPRERAALGTQSGVTGEEAGLAQRLAHATTVLTMVLQFEQAADGLLSAYFRSERRLGHRDRGWIAEAVYGVLRRLRSLRRIAGEAADARRLLLCWLRSVEGWSLRRLEGLISDDERAALIAAHAEDTPRADAGPTLAERCEWPDWLVAQLQSQGSCDEASVLALATALNLPAPLDVRVNRARLGRDVLLRELQGEGLAVVATPYSPDGLRFADKPALNRHPRFLDGSFEVQDEGSQLLSLLLQPRRGQMVVDFCAGAGGKTLHLGALMRSTGRLYALDVADKRLARLKPRVARAGLSNVHPMRIDSEHDARLKRMRDKADAVLVDAPCSGLGTLRRNPDLKWRQSPERVAALCETQASILAAAARLVRPGGRLVYATCSLLAVENASVAEAFAAAHPQFVPLDAGPILSSQQVGDVDALVDGGYLRLLPHRHHTDGFFAAVFERCE